jgi:hypothetical protein
MTTICDRAIKNPDRFDRFLLSQHSDWAIDPGEQFPHCTTAIAGGTGHHLPRSAAPRAFGSAGNPPAPGTVKELRSGASV